MNMKKISGKNPFLDESLPIEKRLDWLLTAMTIDEKLECLATRVPTLERLGIAGFSVGGEAAHGVEARNDQNGEGAAEPTTSFPQPIGMSATWDPELIRKAGAVTGKEARVLYQRHPDRGLSRWAPTVDLERDPRWGRTEEGYGEDPLLIGEMAGAFVRGLQGDHPKYLQTAATLKHFYGNNTEEGRVYKSTSLDPRNKMELYLEPFRRVIEDSHAEAVMTAYNRVNGIPGMLNPEVKEILKEQYGVGHVVCDGGAMELVANMHHYYGTHAETLANAVRAGVDGMSDNPEVVKAAAREAYELHMISEAEIDTALRNMFRTKLRLGIYDEERSNPYNLVTEADLNSEENKEICRQVSREAIVLLKNENEILPVTEEKWESAALIGPLADVWYPDWYGGTPPYQKTLRQGICEVTGKEIPCADGRDRVIFRYGNKGAAVAEDGTLILSEHPDVFIMDDWGCGNYTFQSVRTGKYMNTRLSGKDGDESERGRIAAERENVLDWFVMELFHLEKQEDGTVILKERFGSPVQIDEDERLVSMQEAGVPAAFELEIVEDGLKRACELAKNSELVILALGCNSMVNAKEEVDRTTLALPPVQEQLLREVHKVNPNIILVLLSNYPYTINYAKEKIPAILWSASGSQEMGTAMAETLIGKNAPAGRLNLTWYSADDQLPDMDDYDIIQNGRTYRYFEGEVLYPFGYGLTYSTFAYSDLKAELFDYTKIRVSFQLENTGTAKSDEVVQVYGTVSPSRVKKPLRQLIAFERVKNMCPGEVRQINMEIPISEFRFYDVISRTMMVEEGSYLIAVGPSSAQCELSSFVQLPGKETGLRELKIRTAAEHYDESAGIILTEGQFGYTAAAVRHKKGSAGKLIYRDCRFEKGMNQMRLRAKCVPGDRIEIWINGRKTAEYTEITNNFSSMFRDLTVPIEWKISAVKEEFQEQIAAEVKNTDSLCREEDMAKSGTLEIRLHKNAELSWFRIE